MKEKIILNKQMITDSQSSVFDLANSVLYDLCKKHFDHKSQDVIIAKTTLIGKTYAVALERGKNKDKKDDYQKLLEELKEYPDFYNDKIAPIFKESNIDAELADLKTEKYPTEDNIPRILKLHFYLQSILIPINEGAKRSFSSKYLHFHLPNLFFIYDRRAELVIDKFISSKDVKPFENLGYDKKYSNFYLKAYTLQQKVLNDSNFNERLTPRNIDNLFLPLANEEINKKEKKKLEDKLKKNNSQILPMPI